MLMTRDNKTFFWTKDEDIFWWTVQNQIRVLFKKNKNPAERKILESFGRSHQPRRTHGHYFFIHTVVLSTHLNKDLAFTYLA